MNQLGESTPNTGRNKTGGWLAIGCSLITLCAICLSALVFVGGGFYAWTNTVNTRAPLTIELTYPTRVQVNDTIEVQVKMSNTANQLFIVDFVTIDSSLELNWGRGLSLVSVLPPHTNLIERDQKQFIYFPLTVQSQQSNTIKLKFKATQRGIFRGLIFIDGKLEETSGDLHTPPKQIEVKVE